MRSVGLLAGVAEHLAKNSPVDIIDEILRRLLAAS